MPFLFDWVHPARLPPRLAEDGSLIWLLASTNAFTAPPSRQLQLGKSGRNRS